MAEAATTIQNTYTQPKPQSLGMATLYVGDLDQEVSEPLLFEKFSTVGPIVTIRVCRDIVTKRSLGYAYVNFQQPADAERALDSLNYEMIRGKPMRIMWSQRDPSMRKSGVGNIFIKNLDKSIDTKTLHDTFSVFGTILSCKVMTDTEGKSLGFGFVHFEIETSSKDAIDKVNGMLIAGKKVFVGPFLSRNQRIMINGPTKIRNLFIKNFADLFDTESFQEYFKRFGPIISAKVMLDPDGKSKGFGFCSFEKYEDAEKAVEECKDLVMEDRKIFVLPFKSKKERTEEKRKANDLRRQEMLQRYQSVNLYVKHLDADVDDAKLKDAFLKYGTITSAKVMTLNGQSRGFGFVCFSTPDDATRALTEMNGTLLGSKPLFVALAQAKERRRAILAQRFAQGSTHRHAPQLALPYGSGVTNIIPYMNSRMNMMGTHQMYPGAVPMSMRAQQRWSVPNQANVDNIRYTAMNQQVGSPVYPPASFMQQPYTYQNSYPRNINGASRTTTHANTYNPLTNTARNTTHGQRPAAEYTAVARNMPNASANNAARIPNDPEQLTAAALANASPQQQKQMLGERLYPLIYKLQPSLAGKITGMLLEIDNTELLHMLESHDALLDKVNEAVAVLVAHQQKQNSAANMAVNNLS